MVPAFTGGESYRGTFDRFVGSQLQQRKESASALPGWTECGGGMPGMGREAAHPRSPSRYSARWILVAGHPGPNARPATALRAAPEVVIS